MPGIIVIFTEYYLNVQTMSNEMILIQDLIHEIRGKKVMLDFDLARLYQVETRVNSSRSQFVTLDNPGRGSNVKYKPFVFTEQGVAMLFSVLRSETAIQANIAIMRAFVQVREYLLAASSVSSELKELRAKVDLLASREDEDRGNIDTLYKAIGELAARLEERKKEPRPRIGFK